MPNLANADSLRRVAMLSPEEQAASDAFESSDPARLELEQAIASEPDPRKRQILQQLHSARFGGSAVPQPGGLGGYLESQGSPAGAGAQKQQSLSEFLSNLPTPAPAPAPSGFVRRAIGDTAVSLGRGIIGVPEALTGMADLVTGGEAGKVMQDLGVDYKRAKDILSELYSPEQQAANEAVNKAEGFVPTVAAMLENPSTIVQQAAESAPSMLPGAGVARTVMKVAPAIGPIVAGAIGEGATAAGQNAEQVRQEDPNGTLTAEQAAILAMSGALTAGIGAGAGKVANKLGIGDVHTMLAAGKMGPVGEEAAATAAGKGLIRKAAEGAATEGVLQELPQSYQEQVAQNLAQGKPWDQGAASAGAQGMLAGGLMGAVGGPLEGNHHPTPGDAIREGKLPEMGPLTKGLNAGIEFNAQQADQTLADAQARAAAEKGLALAPDHANGINFEPDAQFANAPIINGGLTPTSPQFGSKQAADIYIGQNDLLGKAQAIESSPGVFTLAPAPQTPDQAKALSDANISRFMTEQQPMTLQQAQEIKQKAAQLKGLDFTVLPHPGGAGFGVLPTAWIDAQARQQVPQGEGAGMLPGPDHVAPDSDLMVAGADGVRHATYGDLSSAAAAQQDAERKAALGLTPDVEKAQAARADILETNGQPFKSLVRARRAQTINGGELVPVNGGYVVRAPASRQLAMDAQPTGRLIAGREGVRAETKIDTLARRDADAAAQAEAERKAALGLTPDVEKAQADRFASGPQSADMASHQIDDRWSAFHPDTGTLGLPRAEMPQIKAEHRGPMVNFLNARGIEHTHETLHPKYIKPTQAEFSQSKVQQAKEFTGGDRSILISSDNHVLDGHHQWLAKREAGEPVKAIRLKAPIKDLIGHVKEFPSAQVSEGATKAPEVPHAQSAPERHDEQQDKPTPKPNDDVDKMSRSEATSEAERNALRELSRNDELFRLPKSDKDTVEGIAADNDPGIKVKKVQGLPGRTEYQFTMPDGSTARMVVRPENPYGRNVYGFDYADGETSNVLDQRPGDNPEDVPPKEDVWIDVSLLKPGQDGAKIYNIAATYAHNTGRIFIGDPAGLSDDALLRRPEQMLSSALKFGTTEHIAPHPRQILGDKSLGVPGLKWIYGDDLGNIRRLIDVNQKVLENGGLDAITFDPQSGSFKDSEGSDIDRAALKALAVGAGLGRTARAGADTIARGAVLRALLRESGSQGEGALGGRDDLLARLVSVSAAHDEATRRIFYSRGDEGRVSPGGLPLEIGQKLAKQFSDLGLKDIHVARTLDDIPDAQRQRLEARNTDGVRGLYFPKEDQVWVLLDNVHSPEEFTFVAVHEAFHRGLRAIFGKDGQTIMRQMYQSNARLQQRADKLAGQLGVGKDEAIEEALADMAAEGSLKQLTGWKKLFGMIRDWLGKLAKSVGAHINFTDGMIESFVAGVSKAGLRVDPASAVHTLAEAPAFDDASAMMSRAGALDGLHQALADAGDNLGKVKLPAGYLVQDFFHHDGKLSWWHKTVGTPYNLAQRSPQFARVYNAVQSFINDVSTYANQAADMAPTIIPKLEDLADIKKQPLSPEDTKALSRPVFEGTLNWTRDEEGKPIKAGDASSAGVVWKDAELKSMFGLNDHQVELYKEFRQTVDKSIASLAISDMLRFAGADAAGLRDQAMAMDDVSKAADLIADHLENVANSGPERADVLKDTAASIREKAERAKNLMDRGYAPLSRFGQYTVYVTKGDDQLYFGMFESRSEANRMARRMRSEHPDATIQQGTVSQQAYRLFTGVSPETLELFGEMLGLEGQGDEASHQAFQTYLKLAKNNRSAMKRLIERKGVAGFSEDAGRVLAGFVYSNARQTASNLNMREISEGTNAIPQELGELKDAAVKLADYVNNPQEEAQALRGLLFTQYIGGSVASALVNLTQPAAVTFPYLSQFGGVAQAAKQMTQATRDALKRTTGDKALDEALKKAEQEGVVSPQEVHQLMAQAGGRAGLKSGDGTTVGNLAAKGSNFMSKALLGWGKLFSTAEQFNRRVTFIAAYRTAIAQGMDNPFKFAEKAVQETQFVQNKGNKPQWARGAVGATLFTFKSYSVNYVELISRMWRSGPEGKKAALLALGVLALLSGTDGLPFEDDIENLVDGIVQRLGYNFSSKRAKREFLDNLLGQDGAQFVSKGISGVPGMPIDFAGRMGMGHLIPGSGALTKKADHSADMTEMMGAAGDFAKRLGTAANSLAGGDVGGAFDAAAPKAISNLNKAYDMVNTGMYRDSKGRKVIDTTPGEAFLKGIGFQPNSVARLQEAAGQAQDMKDQNNLRKSELTSQLANAMFMGDEQAKQDARAAVRQWNVDNPDTPIRINTATLQKLVQQMRKSKEARMSETAPREIRGAVRREMAGASE